MTTRTRPVRHGRLPALLLAALWLTAGAAVAAEEPKPPAPPAAETKPPAETKPKAKTPAKTKAPAASTATTTPPAMNTTEQAAATLRTQGQVVSQSGDMKIGVEANTFSEFPGFDLSKLPAAAREKVVKRSNTTYCTCGCKGDTVARCVVTDPTCGVARNMLQEIINRESAVPAPALAR